MPKSKGADEVLLTYRIFFRYNIPCSVFARQKRQVEGMFEIGNYVEAARGVAAEMEVEFLDMFHTLGNNAESRMEHLDDGVHLSAEGRKVYSDAVIHFLETLEAGNVE